ncbi:MAG: hypothetical protein EZS28_049189, partial [Streblomastix strix]
ISFSANCALDPQSGISIQKKHECATGREADTGD